VRVLRFGEVDSTQRVAREQAEAGAPHGTVVVAEAQTAGRGRLGRTWVAAPGESLLLTVVLRPPGPARDAPLLTLGAAAGIARALRVWVKWPNDLVDGEGRKLGGLLAEMEVAERGPGGGEPTGIRYVLLGLGLNVEQRAFGPELPNATSLALVRGEAGTLGDPAAPGAGRGVDRDALLESVVDAILGWSGHPGRLDLWRERSGTLGRRVRVGGVEGVATALRDDGALVVGGVAVTAGEVEMVEVGRGGG
jgi:BirA family biotin operon repressor/biotin-[acetyl-CoA-carboxylase] ligase